MGLFKKERGAGFGTAAFVEADIEDARRAHPAVSLEGFASSAGLAFEGSEQAGAFVATLPTWPEYVFNVCRGPLAGGRYGMVAHELHEVRAHNGTVEAAGAFVDIRRNEWIGGFEVGGIDQRQEKNEPFWGRAAWIPTTTAHVRAPETNRVPVLRFTRSVSHGVAADGNGLDAFGLPDFRTLGPDLDPQVLGVVARAVVPLLTGRSDPHVSLRVRYGVVALTVNGYRADPADLRHLLDSTAGIADALAAVTPPASNQAFDRPGPPAGSVAVAPGHPTPDPAMVPHYAQQAAAWGLLHEDPSHLLGLLPRCPIPGIPSGVIAGRLPGGTAPARIVWFEQGGRTAGSVRGGLVVPAAPGASTPVGGLLDAQADAYVEVVDGMAYAWRRLRSFNALEADVLLASTTAALRNAGIAAV